MSTENKTPMAGFRSVLAELKARKQLSFDSDEDRLLIIKLIQSIAAAKDDLFQLPTIELVKLWHDTFEVPMPSSPDLSNQDVNKLRVSLLREETNELATALRKGDVIEALDALADLQYVLDGAFLTLGLAKYKTAAFNEVQRSNMSKLGADGKPIRREDGKILKGPNYSEPDLVGAIPELAAYVRRYPKKTTVKQLVKPILVEEVAK